jgi:hypothetical protein
MAFIVGCSIDGRPATVHGTPSGLAILIAGSVLLDGSGSVPLPPYDSLRRAVSRCNIGGRLQRENGLDELFGCL